MEANEKTDLLEKYCAALMAKQPLPPLQDSAADQLQQIRVLTDKVNRLESNSGGKAVMEAEEAEEAEEVIDP